MMIRVSLMEALKMSRKSKLRGQHFTQLSLSQMSLLFRSLLTSLIDFHMMCLKQSVKTWLKRNLIWYTRDTCFCITKLRTLCRMRASYRSKRFKPHLIIYKEYIQLQPQTFKQKWEAKPLKSHRWTLKSWWWRRMRGLTETTNWRATLILALLTCLKVLTLGLELMQLGFLKKLETLLLSMKNKI